MRNLTTIILGAVSLLLAIVISAVERGPRSGDRMSNHLLRFEDRNVQTITLIRGGQSVVMKQVRGYWFFTSPEQEKISPTSMATLLDQLNHLSILDRLEESELVKEMSLTNLGMEGDEALQVVIETLVGGKARTEKLVIGRTTPRVNSVYARVENGKKANGIAVVNGNPHDILDSPFETLMEHQLVTIPPKALVQVAIKTANKGVVVQRNITTGIETPWAIVHPIPAKADQEKVEDLLSSLLSLQIMSVDSYDSSPIAIPNPIPEDAALIQFGVYGSEKPITLYLEKDKTEADTFGPSMLMARISDRAAKYRINSNLLEGWNATAGELRDRRLGNIPEQALESIAIVRDEPKVEVFLKANRNAQGVNWVVLSNGQEMDANYAKINQLIEQMNKPVIIDFVEDGKLTDYGIEKDSALRVYFNFKIPGAVKEDGTTGEDEKFTRILRLGWKEGKNRRLFANFNGETSIFELDPGFATLLPTHPIKWRSLNVLSLNSLRIEKIQKEVQGQGTIELEYILKLDSWVAKRSDGTDVSNQLDKAMADGLRDRLSSLKALGWNLNVAEGYKLLEKPDTIFKITTREMDRAINNPDHHVTRVLKLVESNGIIYGRIDEKPDLFFLDRDKYKLLRQPLTSFAAP